MPDKWVKNGTGKPGKPAGNKSKQITLDIKGAYDNGWSIRYAAQQLDYNEKTIAAHYKELREVMVEELNSDFATEQRHHKEICMTKLDRMIDRLENELAIIDLKINENENDMEYEWRKYRLELIDRIAILAQQKTDIQMRPTIDIDLDKMIEERIAESEELESKKPTRT